MNPLEAFGEAVIDALADVITYPSRLRARRREARLDRHLGAPLDWKAGDRVFIEYISWAWVTVRIVDDGARTATVSGRSGMYWTAYSNWVRRNPDGTITAPTESTDPHV